MGKKKRRKKAVKQLTAFVAGAVTKIVVDTLSELGDRLAAHKRHHHKHDQGDGEEREGDEEATAERVH